MCRGFKSLLRYHDNPMILHGDPDWRQPRGQTRSGQLGGQLGKSVLFLCFSSFVMAL